MFNNCYSIVILLAFHCSFMTPAIIVKGNDHPYEQWTSLARSNKGTKMCVCVPYSLTESMMWPSEITIFQITLSKCPSCAFACSMKPWNWSQKNGMQASRDHADNQWSLRKRIAAIFTSHLRCACARKMPSKSLWWMRQRNIIYRRGC